MQNVAFRIDTAEDDLVERAITHAPQYGVKVASALQRTIRTIHGIADLHQRAQLSDIEVYLGRSSDSAAHLLSRWRSHHGSRKHRYATVLFTCDASRAVELEGLAIKMLHRLKHHETLCVANANVAQGGGGGLPSTDRAIVYLTWTAFAEETFFEKPGTDAIRAIAGELADAHPAFSRRSLEVGLMGLKRLSDKERLSWVPD